MKSPFQPKSICQMALLAAAAFFTTNANAQTWNGSGVSTWSQDNAAIGTTPNDASLYLQTYPTSDRYTRTSLRIKNYFCEGCALSPIEGEEWNPFNPHYYNIVEVFSEKFAMINGQPSHFVQTVPVIPNFVVNQSGKVGVGSQPDDSRPFIFDVGGKSHFNDKVVIGRIDLPMAGAPPPAVNRDYRLYVEKGILTERVKVASSTGVDWSDFVFNDDYKLMPLEEVDNYIKENKHLPEIPSAEEVAKDGIDLAEMDAKLLQKIEELTLYMIDMKKENEALRARVKKLERK